MKIKDLIKLKFSVRIKVLILCISLICLLLIIGRVILKSNNSIYKAYSPHLTTNITSSMSCVGSKFCIAVVVNEGENVPSGPNLGHIYLYDGAVWHATNYTIADALTPSISCATTKFCMIASTEYISNLSYKEPPDRPVLYLFVDGNISQINQNELPYGIGLPGNKYDQVSCEAVENCMITWYLTDLKSFLILDYSHGTWKKISSFVIPNLGLVFKFSCWLPDHCIATENYGLSELKLYELNGSKFTLLENIFTGKNDAFESAVSCLVGIQSCGILTQQNYYLFNNGSLEAYSIAKVIKLTYGQFNIINFTCVTSQKCAVILQYNTNIYANNSYKAVVLDKGEIESYNLGTLSNLQQSEMENLTVNFISKNKLMIGSVQGYSIIEII
jgi:hypothetical protein